ncbi:MAG: glucodextranase DOMON-like domain-containing protein [Acidobacteriota bacterium]
MDPRTTFWTRLVIVSAALLLLAAPSWAGKSQLIFELEDPRGDDHGNGRLEYPIRSDYVKGDLDLVKFQARKVGGGTQFEAIFARPIRVAGREAIDDLGTSLSSVARHGFYTFNIDVYIDTDRTTGSGWVRLLPGRKAEMEAGHAWDRAVVLTPRPSETRAALQRMMLGALNEQLQNSDYSEEDGTEISSRILMQRRLPAELEQRIHFPQKIRIHGRKICFFVPDRFLGGPARDDWSYTVVVSGADLVQSFDISASMGLAESTKDNLMILPISPGRWQDRFGGGREGEALQPPLVDIIVPAGGLTQERVLGRFNTRSDRPVQLSGVVPAELGDDTSSAVAPAETAEPAADGPATGLGGVSGR